MPPRIAAISIILFWTAYYASVTARAAIMSYPHHSAMLDNRLGVTLAGMGFTWLLYLFLRRFDRQRLAVRIAAAFLASLPVAAAYAAVNYWSFEVYDPLPDKPMTRSCEAAPTEEKREKPAVTVVAENAIHWYFFVASWAALYLALSYAAAVRESERETARLRSAAQAAELRALRYQVNPHFLFNTLNSLSSLVLSGRNAEAEAMILNLSSFFRTSLAAEPTEDVPLADELALQRHYLDIETIRFPGRLHTVFDIDPEVADACVPGMILQPLIENAIKYGVAAARRPVTITVRAEEKARMLHLTVEDDGDATGTVEPGHGVGLRNVRDRLATRYGEAGTLHAGPRRGGGYIATVTLPLSRHGC